MISNLLVAATLVLSTTGFAHGDESSFYVMFPGTEPVSGAFEASWSPGGTEYDVAISKTKNCATPVFSKKVRTTSVNVPGVKAGTYFFCLKTKSEDGHTVSARNTPVEFTAK